MDAYLSIINEFLHRQVPDLRYYLKGYKVDLNDSYHKTYIKCRGQLKFHFLYQRSQFEAEDQEYRHIMSHSSSQGWHFHKLVVHDKEEVLFLFVVSSLINAAC